MSKRLQFPNRRGAKIEITLNVAVQNIIAVATRLNVSRLPVRQYNLHGSYHPRALQKKWYWSYLCRLAGLESLWRPGRPRQHRCLCTQCEQRMSRTIGRYCRTCVRRINRIA